MENDRWKMIDKKGFKDSRGQGFEEEKDVSVKNK